MCLSMVSLFAIPPITSVMHLDVTADVPQALIWILTQ